MMSSGTKLPLHVRISKGKDLDLMTDDAKSCIKEYDNAAKPVKGKKKAPVAAE